jgi:hypothetical protein
MDRPLLMDGSTIQKLADLLTALAKHLVDVQLVGPAVNGAG